MSKDKLRPATAGSAAFFAPPNACCCCLCLLVAHVLLFLLLCFFSGTCSCLCGLTRATFAGAAQLLVAICQGAWPSSRLASAAAWWTTAAAPTTTCSWSRSPTGFPFERPASSSFVGYCFFLQTIRLSWEKSRAQSLLSMSLSPFWLILKGNATGNQPV